MLKNRVTCINKSNRFDPHERILAIGGQYPNGTFWKLSQSQAIAHIESGKYSFYVEKNGQRADVIVATSRFGNRYLKTIADGEQPNNLLSLMECVA